jgi:hypothetical protein
VPASIVEVSEPQGVVEGKKTRIGDAWMQRSSEPSAKGRLKRESTMDRLRAKEGYESRGKKRVEESGSRSNEASVDSKPMAKTGKRQTERMMASIMRRQGRDTEKEGSGGRKV